VETHESSGRKCVRVVYGKFHIIAESEFARGKTCRDVSTTTATKTLSGVFNNCKCTLIDDSIQELTSSTNKEACLPTSRFQQLLISLREIWPYI